ncbi:hypothetical protein niasHS_007400 [Heterodera schachtii]|uniref:Uncharacterized protein n=1 Tax=Heterodera schachtii TaxID=97005 RepID=A0ABD2JXD8_HETSC
MWIIALSWAFSLSNLAYSGPLPSISEHPLDILVVKDDPATLRCGVTGSDVEITWYKDSVPVRVGNGHRLLLPNGSLFLLKVNSGGTDSDAGVYHCVARNQFGEVRSQEANLRVAMLRDDFRLNPHAVQTLTGNRVSLECSPPKGIPEPVVTWRKDDRELSTQEDEKYHQNPDGSLIIENAQRSDAGFYQCVASNSVGQRVSKPARLSVFDKPVFLIEPKNVVAELNLSVHFDCRVIGEPMPSISWKKLNGQMPVGRAYVAKDRGGLRIDKIQLEDAGDYVCHAKNPVGSIESSAKLRVNAPPTFTKMPQNLRLNQGRTAVFECEAIGQPPPGIFWSKEGDQLFTFFSGLVSSDGRIQVTKEGRLIIDNVRQLDQGNYVCAAVNSAGSTLSKASLGVINDGNSTYPPPIIQYGHQNQTLMFSDMAILPCQATGRVPVRITWLRDGKELDLDAMQHKGRYRQLPVGTLQITDLKKEDSGVYTCRASNEDGEATWTASLVSEGHTNQDTVFHRMPDAAALPSSPGQPKVLNVTENSIELEWASPERHGSSPITDYLLQYWSPELGESWRNILDVVAKSRFRITGLQPEHSYVFVIRAENSKGIGLPSSMSEIVSTKKSTEIEEGNYRSQRMNRLLDLETARQRLSSEQLVKLLEVRALNATAVLLAWKRQRNEPLVQGYYIKWRGPPLAQDHSWVNVTNPETDHVVINGLRPFNNYEFFVIPYHQTVQGMPSNSLDGTTAESPPNMPPSDVRLRMLNVTSLRVSWRPPPADAINGILKGFIINIKSNHSSVEDRNITTNERATSVTLYRLIPNASYAIRVAARTNAGVGAFYIGEPVVMTEETLNRHIRLFERSENVWYRQPWSVLVCGIVLWCLLLLLMVLFWFRCCHQKGRSAAEAKEREFIKIRDGSVANSTTMVGGDARNAFWVAHEQFNGGTVETSSGTLARVGGQQNHQQHLSYFQPTNYPADRVPGPHNDAVNGQHQIALSNEMFSNGIPMVGRICPTVTLQRHNGGDCSSPNSPHYHYAHLPFYAEQNNSLSTFLQQRPNPELYDDPSPYATTTLVSPTGVITQTLRPAVRQSKGPALPLKPAPKEPPKNFLSSAAVMHLTTNSKQRVNGNLEVVEQQPNSSSCGALLELNREWKRQQRITAEEQKKRETQQKKGGTTAQRRENEHDRDMGENRTYGTTGRGTRGGGGGGRRSQRSSSANTAQKQSSAFCSLRRVSHKENGSECRQNQQDSPQTDISYLQSSDGTNGSNNNNNTKRSQQMNRQVKYDDTAPEYDPVMTDSLSQIVHREDIRKKRGREKANRIVHSNRVSLIEDEGQEERDPLMEDAFGGDEDELDADGEMSENEHSGKESDRRAKRTADPMKRCEEECSVANEHYYGFSPAPKRPNRQPMMGINVSTLSVGVDRRTTASPAHR